MSTATAYIYPRLHIFRRIVQLLALLFIFVVPLLNKFDFNFLLGTYYSFTLGHFVILDPAIFIQFLLLNNTTTLALFIAALFPFLLAALLGKVFCSWICPFNLFAEMVQYLRKRWRRGTGPFRFHNPPASIYWIIFAAFIVLLAVLGLPLITYFSLPGLISAQIADFIIHGQLGVELALVAIILLLEFLWAPRFWCKYVCPVGATLALPFNKKSLRIHYSPQKCQACTVPGPQKPCGQACPFHLDPRRPNIYPYCFNCGECVKACFERSKALTLAFPAEHKPRLLRRSGVVEKNYNGGVQ